MKTAESRTKEEVGKFLVDLAMAGIRYWAKQEVNYIRYALNYPVILPVKDKTFIIGNLKVKILGDHSYEVTKENKVIHTFYSKKAAIFYCVFSKINQFIMADKFLNRDMIVAKLYDDINFYNTKLTKKPDAFSKQLWQSRLSEMKSNFILNNRELDKLILTAKYNKRWTNIL